MRSSGSRHGHAARLVASSYVAASHRGPKRVTRVERLMCPICPLALPARSRAARLKRHLQSDQMDGAEGASARSMSSSSSRCAQPQALDDAAWKPQTYEDQIVTGVMMGAGHWRCRRHPPTPVLC